MATSGELTSINYLQAVMEQEAEIEGLTREVYSLRTKLQEALELPIMETAQKLQTAVENKAKMMQHIANEREKKIVKERTRLHEEYKGRDEERNRKAIEYARLVLDNIDDMPQLIELVVGGQTFSISRANIFKEIESVLAKTVAEMLKNAETRNKTKIKIDRDPKHFRKILNYLRDGERSLVWLEDCSIVDMKETRLEANYYHLYKLERFITWGIVSRIVPPVTERDFTTTCSMIPRKREDGAVIGYKTSKEGLFPETNFSGCRFPGVIFNHNQSFISCLFTNVTFIQCTFNVVIDLSGSKLKGIKFVKCRSDVLPPKEIFHVDEDSQCYIPVTWD